MVLDIRSRNIADGGRPHINEVIELPPSACAGPNPQLPSPPMFGRLNVLKDGERIEGIVLDCQTTGVLGKTNSDPLGRSDHRVTFRVHFPDESVEEIETKVKGKDYGMPFGVGETIPLRYDPKDHTRVEVDVPAIKGAHKAEVAEGREQVIDLAELDRKLKAGEISEDEWQSETERLLGL